ncbi:Acyl-CoA dehydrogenase NM domain-like protein [Mycena sanguinolenta]|uniref:Acyl-CoA dehydrogenase NM domain-like protein n=1 Tax=Mycena sanguinolenta TaxID=230812 RepID=A0A8H7CTF7_9AGAR|nr:Acyl-CoA dehydrogenase NM domain-like protein [Mycena sanguinolenta]
MYPGCLAARYEIGLFKECREVLAQKMNGQHRSDAFNRLMLPRCRSLVEAIGQPFLYEAAKEADFEQAVLDVYEAGIVKHGCVWFATHAGMDAAAQIAHEDAAITAAMPHLERWLQWSGAEDYTVAPTVTQPRWDEFVRCLPLYAGPVVDIQLGERGNSSVASAKM